MAKKRNTARKSGKKDPKEPEKELGIIPGVRKNIEFEKYAFFLSLPTPERIEAFGYSTEHEFAKQFKVHPGTLTEWKQHEELWKKRDGYLRSFRRLTADVLASLARRAIKQGYAFEVQTWMKLVEGWSEKSSVDITSRDKRIDGFEIVIVPPENENPGSPNKKAQPRPDRGDDRTAEKPAGAQAHRRQ